MLEQTQGHWSFVFWHFWKFLVSVEATSVPNDYTCYISDTQAFLGRVLDQYVGGVLNICYENCLWANTPG